MALSKSVQAWFRKADEDLFMARYVRASENKIAFNPIAFHCQQAIEKSLKGFLTHHGRKFEKKHDLVYILELVSQIDAELSHMLMPAIELIPYAAVFRYPDTPVEPPDLKVADIDRFIALAVHAYDEILARIQDKGPLL